ncbi:MAG: OmpW family outer membrane protein [Acidobacteriota bacterium]
MLRQNAGVAILALSLLGLAARPAPAQQSISVQFGAFAPRSQDARAAGDVLVTDRQYLLFNLSDLKGLSGGGEWLIGAGDHLEFGLGVSYFQRALPSVYEAWVNADGSDIAQDLKLRVIPVMATVKYLPFGAQAAFQPYVGVGLAVYLWHYSETGQFVDFKDNSIYRAAYVSTGTAVGPVATFGVRARMSRQADAGVEVRAQWGQGALSNDFLSNKIDLGGVSLLATIRIRF